MKLIGIHGKAGSGKDTVAQFLADNGFERYAFADPIKKALKAAFFLGNEHFEDRALKESEIDWIGKSPRRLAQLFGTEFGRQLVADDIWIRCAQRQLDNLRDMERETFMPFAGLVISDVRFENEAAWIRSQGGTVLHLVRPTAAQVEAHSSELGIRFLQGDGAITNNGTIADLLKTVSDFFLQEDEP